MSGEPTRATLLSRVRDPGDQAAWQTFEARYGDLIIRYARARGLQLADAEDIRQHVMLTLARSLRAFQYKPERGRFRSYLGRLVQNAISDFRSRHAGRIVGVDTHVLANHPAARLAETDAAWEQEWADHHYRLALATIRETFDARSVAVFERIVAGAETAEVAAEFGLTEEAVRKVKQRIRERMNELIAQQVRDEDAPDA